ncbi:putative FAD-linked oxidoreductase [subsurface metagenome]
MNEDLFSAIESLIGTGNIKSECDPPVFVPPSEELLVEIIRLTAAAHTGVVSMGKGTFPGPRVPRDAVQLSLTGLTDVKEVNTEDFLAVVQAGAVVDDVCEAVEKQSLFIPMDISSGDESTIGGAYMTGAVGFSALKYGRFENSVIGIRCVTGEGEIVTGGGRTAKNVTGYDLPRFFSGTLGLYGIATELIIKVLPLPESRVVVSARFSDGAKAVSAIMSLIDSHYDMSMLELIACDGLGGEITVGVGLDGMEKIVSGNSEKVKRAMLKSSAVDVSVGEKSRFIPLRQNAAKMLSGDGIITLDVPFSSSSVILEKLRTHFPAIPVIAHPALGRLHVFSTDENLIARLSALSRGIGGKRPVVWNRLKDGSLSDQFTDNEIEIARSLKRQLDPGNVLNPQWRL